METPAEIRQRWAYLRDLLIDQLSRFESGALRMTTGGDDISPAAISKLKRKYGGSIALSGLTGGNTVATTVFPFILRGVNLLGIDSVMCPMPKRQAVWARLGKDLKPRGLLDSIAVETDLAGVQAVCTDILSGKVKGRTLVKL